MRARELAEALMSTESDSSDGPEIKVLIEVTGGRLGQYRVKAVKSEDVETAYIVCEPDVEGPPPRPKTTEEKVAFRKEWDARVDKSKENPRRSPTWGPWGDEGRQGD